MRAPAAPWSGQDGWHRADWGWWGWAETAPKGVAIVVAVVAAAVDGAVAVPDDHAVPYWLLVAAAVGYVLAIVDRLLDRELFALAFVAAMVVGHWAMVYAAGREDWPAALVRVFTGLMIVGDLVKLGYFGTTGTRVRNLPPAVPLSMTGGLLLLYVVAFVAA